MCQSIEFSEQEKRAILSSSLTPFCSICLTGKQTAWGISQSPATNRAVRGRYPGELLSLDLIGPMRCQSVGGHAYLLTVTNSFSQMHFVQPLPNKSSSAISAALRTIAVVFPPSVRVHRVRLDNTRELDTLVGEWILKASGKREPTPPYTLEYNGVIKRFNCEIMTHVQCLLFNARLSGEWWAEAARYMCDLINITPTQSNLASVSLFSLWHGVPPPTQHLRVFGALGMMRLHDHKHHKISVQSVPVCLLGVVDYSSSTYRVYVVGQRRAVDTRNIVFDERSASRPPEDPLQPGAAISYVLLLDDDDDKDGDTLLPQVHNAGLVSATLDTGEVPTTPAHKEEAATTGPHALDTPAKAMPVAVPSPIPATLAPLAAPTKPEQSTSIVQIINSVRGTVSSKQVEQAAAASAKHGGDVVTVT